jgi:putative membrane protein
MPSNDNRRSFDMMGFGGMGWGAGTLLGPIFMILFWVVLVAGTVWLVLAISGQRAQRETPSSSALAILEERLAHGEIDVDEYTARRAAIGGAR